MDVDGVGSGVFAEAAGAKATTPVTVATVTATADRRRAERVGKKELSWRGRGQGCPSVQAG
ncbi:hypothetical protein GCM10022232_58010 [Streptomyces plumbiresistens]|uniref:Uncharacterized protein n=1 Tax=Streptomyces plumbiresistens TaxID=511811 RepID=A0ABP7SBX9_9ACTN